MGQMTHALFLVFSYYLSSNRYQKENSKTWFTFLP